MRHETAYLYDILIASKSVITFIDGLSEEEFHASGLHQSAVVRQLEIIGEATKKISKVFREAHPEIPWKNMAAMRDILIHAYNTVNIRMVWKVTKEDLPTLIDLVEKLVSPDGETKV